MLHQKLIFSFIFRIIAKLFFQRIFGNFSVISWHNRALVSDSSYCSFLAVYFKKKPYIRQRTLVFKFISFKKALTKFLLLFV